MRLVFGSGLRNAVVREKACEKARRSKALLEAQRVSELDQILCVLQRVSGKPEKHAQ